MDAAAALERAFGPKLFYTAREVAEATGVPVRTVTEEMREGRMRYFLPRGRANGRVCRAEWVDEWIEAGTHGARR